MTGFSPNELDRLWVETRSAFQIGRTGADTPGPPGSSAAGAPVEGTGESPGALVRATVSADRLTDLRFEARAMRMASHELGEHIVAAVNAAFEDLRARSAGGSAAATEALSEQVRQIQELSLSQMRVLGQSVSDLMTRLHGGRP